jgi:hypothetical protein
LVVCVQVPHHLQSSLSLLSWSINLGILTEGKLAAILIIPSSWDSQRAGFPPRTRTVCSTSTTRQQPLFWRHQQVAKGCRWRIRRTMGRGERKGKQWHGHGHGAGLGSHFATVTWVSCASGALTWTSCGSHDDLDKWRRVHCGAPIAAPLASTNQRSTKRDFSRLSSLWGFQTKAWAKLRKN